MVPTSGNLNNKKIRKSRSEVVVVIFVVIALTVTVVFVIVVEIVTVAVTVEISSCLILSYEIRFVGFGQVMTNNFGNVQA